MKKRYWVMLCGAYAASMIGYFVYQYRENRRSSEQILPYTHTHYTTTTSSTAPELTTSSSTSQTTASTTSVTNQPTTTVTASTQTTTTARTTTAATEVPATSTATTTTETTTTMESTTTTAVSYPLDLNTATFEQLCTLPDIGEVLAQAIIDYRTAHGGFINRKELLDIPGIGEGRYDEIRWLLYLDNEQPLPEPTAAATAPPTEEPSPAQPAETTPLYIDLNTASKDDLLRLPGCDDAAADAILWLRDEIHVFHNPAELLMLDDKISNIDSLFSAWKPYLFVDANGSTQLP